MGSCARNVRISIFHRSVIIILGLGIVTIASLSPIEAWAHGAGGHGGSDTKNTPKQTTSRPSQPRRNVITTNLADRPMQPPHGGQITATKHHYFEVVYTPSDTRVYIYGASQRGINARSIKGDVTMSVHSSGQSLRFPLEVVAQPAFTGDVGYLAAKVDVSQVRPGDMDLRFDMRKLLPEEPEASFTQAFFLTRPPLPVTLTGLSAADRQPVAQQGICPVTETPLGDHGDPIKLVVNNQPVYVCCAGCIQRVQNDPYGYVQKTANIVQGNFSMDKAARNSRAVQQSTPNPAVSVSTATAADVPAVRAQGVCPVTDEPLDSMGAPIKVTVDGRTMFVCCQGCVSDVVENFEANAQKLAARRPANQPVAHNQPGHDHATHGHGAHDHTPEPARQSPALSPPPAYAGNAIQPAAPTVVVAETTAADAAAIRAQGNCPVMKQPLGGHGTPIKLLVDGQPVFVCCQGCIDKVKKDPLSYISQTVHKQPVNLDTRQESRLYERPAPSPSQAGGSCCSSGKGASCH